MNPGLDPRRAVESVKRVVIAESRLSLKPADLSIDEPLNGELLKLNSLGFVGMLVRLEDELDVILPDELFVGRSFRTVSDLVDVVVAGAEVAA